MYDEVVKEVRNKVKEETVKEFIQTMYNNHMTIGEIAKVININGEEIQKLLD